MSESASAVFSLIVPVLNEEAVLPSTYRKLTEVLSGLGVSYEVIVCDNGSTDSTPEIAHDICRSDPCWKYVRLSRNFGYQNSITAGMLAARGEAIMVIDCDLQDPPELIPEFLARWREGYDVVYGVRAQRTGESSLRIGLTMLAMRFISWMSDEIKLPQHSGDFRLISRRVRDAYALLPEANRYVRGMIHWLGYRQIGIPYTRRGRTQGESKANPLYLIGFTWNAVFNFSVKPLRLFSLLGVSILAGAGLMVLFHLLVWAFTQQPRGMTTVFVLQLVTLGVLSLGIGVLGEYIARIYAECKQRPLWLIDYTVNFDAGREVHDGARAISLIPLPSKTAAPASPAVRDRAA